MPNAVVLPAFTGTTGASGASGSVAPADSFDCGDASLDLYAAPAHGHGWASFHEDVNLDGECGWFIGGSVGLSFYNFNTGANGGWSDWPTTGDSDWTNYDDRYTQNGYVQGTMESAGTVFSYNGEDEFQLTFAAYAQISLND
jgi:hypothetical protein